MSTTVQQLVDQVRILSGLRRNTYFSDIDISEFIDDGGKELADIFIASNEHYFQTSLDFTLAGGIGGNTLPLPDAFQRANILLLNPTTDCPLPVPMLSSQLERGAAGAGAFTFAGGGRRYFVADQTLEVLPPSAAAGAYRLLYTPQFPSMAFPRTPDATAAVRTAAGTKVGLNYNGNIVFTQSGVEPGRSFTINPNPGAAITINGVPMVGGLDPISGGNGTIVMIANQNAPAENGAFVCRESDAGGTVFFRLETATGLVSMSKGAIVLVTGGTTGGAGYWLSQNTVTTIDTDPITFAQPLLPAVLAPWQRYLKVYGSLTARRGRQQPADDLARELDALKLRAGKMAANRTEEPKQAPITRGRGMPWGGGGW